MTDVNSLTPKQQKHRHRARRLVMQCLYQHAYDPKDITMLIDGMMDQGTLLFDRVYFQKLAQGVMHHLPEVDALLAEHIDRDIDQLNSVERSILRLSAYELKAHIEIPKRVCIDEGVELAKSYGAENSYQYVNAVLDRLSSPLRPYEK